MIPELMRRPSDLIAGRNDEGSDRVVVVTGGSAGLGRSIVREFARQGAQVAVIARDRARLGAVEDEIKREGGRPVTIAADVARWPEVQDAAGRIEAELGPIDVWVNNAMCSVFAPFHRVATDEFIRATEVTYLGYVHGTKAALERMLPRDKGVIVQVGSALAHRGIPLQAAYCGAKHAIVGFTESLRTELMHEHSGVKVTMVHMPAMNTPQFDWVRSHLKKKPQPVAPIYQPEVGARAVLYAADHPRRRAYYVGLSTTLTVIGNKFAPGLLDRYLARTGYGAQLSDELDDPERPDNLFEPVPGPYESHGRFDRRSHARSPWTWLNRVP
jgi:NAD(P)-dependent dehydrogenase (short-subunit alcohol dehydrogenase family)